MAVTFALLKRLSDARIREAQNLLSARLYGGAYYLTGLSIECALKACIAKKTRRNEFPDRRFAQQCHTHDLKELANAAGLASALKNEIQASSLFDRHWKTVKDWDDELRYESVRPATAKDLFVAVTDRANGVLPWVRRFW